jgi:hypothetical protein
MAHFTKIEDGIVVQVLVIGNDDITDENGDEQESLGVALCNQLYGDATWVQTSYNHNFRKQYGSKGYSYDSDKDKFIMPKPYPSWALDENDDWQAPVACPEGKNCRWDEETKSWKEIL